VKYKVLLHTVLIFYGSGLFASNTKVSESVYERKEDKGHLNYSVGSHLFPIGIKGYPLPVFDVGIGWETSFKKERFFQTTLYELHCKIFMGTPLPFPRVEWFHYWKMKQSSRLYTGLGAGLLIIPTGDGIYPIPFPFLTLGVEIGKREFIIQKMGVQIDLLIFYGPKLTYSIGF
jgi:hypothetical protein